MPLVVAAPDKFRGTASAREVAEATCRAAVAMGWSCVQRPMSDGGEGFLDVLGGEPRRTTVDGPLGEPVEARWSLLDDGTALIESAEAAGRARLPHPTGTDPLRASTRGVGQLLAAALAEGATSVVVGCGGSATTDGGRGCLDALDELGATISVPLLVACDVLVAFHDAAGSFGPQKGATPAQVVELELRLRECADAYLERFGVDVAIVPGAGAAGGLAGGLVALGGRVVSGAAYVAGATGLAGELSGADLVVSGEGAVDGGTLGGKVVTSVLALRPELPAVDVAGRADVRAVAVLAERPGPVEVVVLDREVDVREGTTRAIERAVAGALARR